MNQKKLKQLRKLVATIPNDELERRYTTTTFPTITGSQWAQIPLTARYPKASRRRVYQDAKRVLNQAAGHPDIKINRLFKTTLMAQIVHAVN